MQVINVVGSIKTTFPIYVSRIKMLFSLHDLSSSNTNWIEAVSKYMFLISIKSFLAHNNNRNIGSIIEEMKTKSF